MVPSRFFRAVAVAAMALSAAAPAIGDCSCGSVGEGALAAKSGWKMDWIVQLPFDSTRFRLADVTDSADLVVAQSDDGGVHSVVASAGPRNGTVIWSTRLGDLSTHETLPASIGSSIVAAARGRTIHGLRASDGSVAFSKNASGFFEAGPAVSDRFVYEPMAGGGMLQIPTESGTEGERGLTIATYGAVNSAAFPLDGGGIGWITDDGSFVELMPPPKGSTADWDRSTVDLRSPAAGRPVVRGETMRVVTEVGDLVWLARPKLKKAADDRRRKEPELPAVPRPFRVEWRLPLPARPDGGLLVDGGVILVSMGPEGIVAISEDTRMVTWRIEKPLRLLAIGGGTAWCLDAVGRLVVLDLRTGSRIACASLEGFTLPVVSTQPGRLLLASPEGLLAAFSPIDANERAAGR